MTACYMGSHALARELLKERDTFMLAMHEDRELVIESYKKVFTHANIDDTVMNLELVLRDGGNGNIKR